jgi:hypothetical protein
MEHTMDSNPKPATAAGARVDSLGDVQGGRGAGLLPRQEIRDLDPRERHILECLGAAVVSTWSDLPRSVQRAIFEHAAAQQAYDTASLRKQLACFLHDHND